MTYATTNTHHLEDHIEQLRKLDDARKKSGVLMDEGIKILTVPAHETELLKLPVMDVSLAVRAIGTKLNQPFEKGGKQKELLDTIFKLGKSLQTLKLQQIADGDLSVLCAARVLQALVACSGAAFSSCTAMVCYYWIIRELYTAEGSDWNTGGIGAAPKGRVSAFVTGECIHALLNFAEAFQKTGEFIFKVGEFKERSEQLDKLKELEDLKGEIYSARSKYRFPVTLKYCKNT